MSALRSVLCVALLLLLPACSRPEKAAAVAGATPEETAHLEVSGLHNVFRLSQRLYSGSSPDGAAGFAALKELGIKTIISVDGARPDVEQAQRHGMRYVHLPCGYDGIPAERVVSLVKAATELPGPVYVHCHHGKHRGPTAVAAILLCTEPAWNPERAEAWLKTAGTDPRYQALTGLPRSLVRPSREELERTSADFPAVASVADLTRLMVDVDERWEHLKLVRRAGWTVPKKHPDIAPAHEAVQLAEHFREAARLETVKARGPEFARMLIEAETAAGALEQGLRSRPVDPARAEKAFARSAAACNACHARFRDGSKE